MVQQLTGGGGISGTTAKSRKRKFVPSSHPGPFAKGPGCDEGTNLRLRDFAVVPLMPTLATASG